MQPNRDGLGGAGEWHQLKPLIPSLQGKTVLDLGCGYSRVCGIEEYEYPENMWDCVISNLALHYIENIARGAKYAIFRM